MFFVSLPMVYFFVLFNTSGVFLIAQVMEYSFFSTGRWIFGVFSEIMVTSFMIASE